MTRCRTLITALVMLALTSALALAQMIERKIDIYSDGVRMSGWVLSPQAREDEKLPAIIMSHGWGGTAGMLRPQAAHFARAGYFVLLIDYRGWGDSDARWVHDAAASDPAARRELREVIDPLDQATDIFSAIHWVMGEPAVDDKRVGLWGTSFAGGLVAYVAARDPRIKAIVSQVAWFGQGRVNMNADALARAESDATRRARGEISFPPPGSREVSNLRGAPIRESFLRYAPIDDIATLNGCAVLIIDAEREELFNLSEHGELAFQRAREPKKRIVIPHIAHYGVYSSEREHASNLAVEWFDAHLKAQR